MLTIHALYSESECLLAFKLKYIETTVVKCIVVDVFELIICFAKFNNAGCGSLASDIDDLSARDGGNSLGTMPASTYMITRHAE